MIDLSFSFAGECWLWQAEKAAWHFVTMPKKMSEEIEIEVPSSDDSKISFFNENISVKKRGWGSVRVKATIGETTWETSLFPQAKEGTFILPIKADVRKKEKIVVGSEVHVSLVVNL